MALIKKILNKLNGLHFPQEYLCLANESVQQPLHVYLVNDRQIIKDITHSHLFTGYSPLIFTLPALSVNNEELPPAINIIFTDKPRKQNEFFEKKDAIALLSLKIIRKQVTGDHAIYYYEGSRGSHQFLSSFHQYIIGLSNRLYNKQPGNIFLHDNLYKQVQIAYSVPRNISLITVTDGKDYNLFPTDLHGQVNEQYYVDSLRHGGKACQQVLASSRMLISEVGSDFFKTVYELGKNHVQQMKSRENFPFSGLLSERFGLPLPVSALSYRELELTDSFTHGIHRLLLFKIVFQKKLQDSPSTLTHVHNVYASWRHNKGLPGNYLLR